MIHKISIVDYLSGYPDVPLIDVRSPGEYQKAHIPEAHNIPLFTDEERAKVGTMYVQESREKAINLAYRFVEPKREQFVKEAKKLAVDNTLVVHCWRGGMRSKAFAEHIKANGISDVYTIKLGYKAFRKHVLKSFETNAQLQIIGGFTGSGKTQLLYQIQRQGEQIIDLEALAHHKGSVFGGMGKHIELSTEQFENNLFWKWKKLNFSKPIWLEDESANIGPVTIPYPLYKKMREAQVIFLDIPKEKRAEYLVEDYKTCNKDILITNVQKIKKKLGGLESQRAIQFIGEGNYYEAAMIILNYYDKYYLKGLSKRDPGTIIKIKSDQVNPEFNTKLVLENIN